MLLYNLGYTQQTFNYEGILIVKKNNVPLNFKLHLKEKKGVVNGFSITNIGTENETKSEVTGIYFKRDKSFQLKEEQILYTNSEAPLNSFCYLTMHLKFKGMMRKKRLEGTFIGNFLDGTECARGKIILIEQNKIKKIEKKYRKN